MQHMNPTLKSFDLLRDPVQQELMKPQGLVDSVPFINEVADTFINIVDKIQRKEG